METHPIATRTTNRSPAADVNRQIALFALSTYSRSYFDGKVQSLAVNTSEGPATVGVIEPGKYTFKTDSAEHVHVVVGTLKSKLPGAAWQAFARGQSFAVPAHASFDVEAAADVAYLCYYKK